MSVFAELVVFYRLNNNLTQFELASYLQSINPDFTTLDVVTISRWERNKTVPSLRKQMMVLSYLDIQVDFFKRLSMLSDSISEDNILLNVANERYDKFNCYLNDFNHVKKINNYKLNITSYSDIPDKIYKFIHSKTKDTHLNLDQYENHIGHWEKDNDIYGFFFCFFIEEQKLNSFNNIVSIPIEDMIYHIQGECNNAILCYTFNTNKECFELTFLELYIFLLKNFQIENFYFTVKDIKDVKHINKLGMTVELTYQSPLMKKNNIDHSLICKISRLDLLSNKYFFEYAKYLYKKWFLS